jgi:hypothetical protein
VGRVGHLGAQPQADCPEAGSVRGCMRMKELETLLEEYSDHFTHRYGHFAAETSTKSRVMLRLSR